MKKLLVSSLVLFTFAVGLQAQKFGYCNSIAVLSSLPEVKQADSDLKAFQTQLQKKGEEMYKSWQTEVATLEDRNNKGLVAPKELNKRSAELEAERQKIETYQQEVMQKLAEKREDLYTPILERVNKAMKDVAIENGFMFVFDSTTQILLYADETLDVTEKVKTKVMSDPGTGE